jgi:hypothetical protein
MAKKAAKNINFTLNSVAIEDEVTQIALNVKQETVKVDGLSSAGPERVVGNYDYDISLDGNFDGAASQGDATIFGLVGNAGVAAGFDPTGGAAGASDPNYDGTYVLASYSIKGGVGGAVQYSATLEGNGALSRAVA